MKFASRWTTSLAAIVALALVNQATAALIDDFSDTDVSEYTVTAILDANGGGANTAVLGSPSGALQLDTTAYDGIEQYAIIRDGLSLDVGKEVQVDVAHTGDSQDIGLYVGGTTPVAGTRQDYVAVYLRNNGQVFSRGFDGTGEYGLSGGASPAVESLFIARTAANTYETGYYEGGVRNVIVERTPSFANDGDVVGFYADVRALGTLGNWDNLSIVPEPATLLLTGLALVGVAAARRRSS
ncbi:MAG: hypothetical protein CMJ58_27950 [Planctomycetaceae bacterium]|nr:hypothetical protein [Planctomycetaceae bacterium]